MIWLLVALLSGVVAGVGFVRGTPAGLAGEAFPGSAAVIFSLMMFRAASLVNDPKALGKQGGWPLMASGAAALTAALAGAVDAFIWYRTRTSTLAMVALPTAVLAFALLAVSALRLSIGSSRKTHFYALALASVGNAVAGAVLLASQLSTNRH